MTHAFRLVDCAKDRQSPTKNKISKQMVAESKGKKTPRQEFLSALMGETSGEKGEALADAYTKGHHEKVRELLTDVMDAIVKKAKRRGK